MKIKICGITNINDALAAEELGADFIGFNFSRQSSRHIDYTVALTIIEKLKTALPVGIFIEQTAQEIIEQSAALNLYAAQIYHDSLPALNKTKTIFPLLIKNAHSFDQIKSIQADYFLCDSYHAKHYGGTGRKFDWALLPENKTKLFLAGGINPHNARAACKLSPYALDICSGVEQQPGIKDLKKMQQLFNEVSHAR